MSLELREESCRPAEIGDGWARELADRVSFLITGSARLPLLCAFDGCPGEEGDT